MSQRYVSRAVLMTIGCSLLSFLLGIYLSGAHSTAKWFPLSNHWSDDASNSSLPANTALSASSSTDINFAEMDLVGMVSVDSGPTILSSPNGMFTLNLEPTGDLILSKSDGLGGQIPLWWSSTGDSRKGTHHVKLNKEGVLEILWKPLQGYPVSYDVVWHSQLLPQCDNTAHKNYIADAATPMRPRLTLSNSGTLAISSRCTIYSPPSSEVSRLAVIVSGLYRTNKKVCDTHVRNVLNHPNVTEADVFGYMLYEKKDLEDGTTPEDIENSIRHCYGPHLRALTVLPVEEAEELFPGEIPEQCGGKVNRLQSQLKTIHESGLVWWRWAIETGIQHDMVLRLRTDTNFHDDKPPLLHSPKTLGDNILVLPHPATEHYFYCAGASGQTYVGMTDQLAYGSPAAMHTWLSMYVKFPMIVELAGAEKTGPAHRGFAGCERLPGGTSSETCNWWAACSIECMVGWYLDAMQVKFMIEWNWNQNLLRG